MLAADVALDRGAFALEAAIDVPAGGRLALVGPSGAGKSTLLRLLAGLLVPDRGKIALGGERWFDGDAGIAVPAERRRVGFVFQDYALFPRMSAAQNVAYGLRGPRRSRRAGALAALDRFGLAARADALPADLSGGERQRVALARALASGPRLLLLDEPLSALDARTRAAAARELASVLAAAEAPAIVVTHDFAEAAQLAGTVAVLDSGRIVQRGTAAELASAPASGLVADLAGATVLEGDASPGEGGLTRVELAGGGTIFSTEAAVGPVSAGVFPWEIAVDPAGAPAPSGSALNRLSAEVRTVTEFGNRARIGLVVPQPLAAEVTAASIARLGLRPGTPVVVSWKATATRLAPR
ncbi:MAG: ABC transporter ATP-binding protein [Solirubrobacterales bacterium]